LKNPEKRRNKRVNEGSPALPESLMICRFF
jgi:hypothetical protein